MDLLLQTAPTFKQVAGNDEPPQSEHCFILYALYLCNELRSVDNGTTIPVHESMHSKLERVMQKLRSKGLIVKWEAEKSQLDIYW